MSFHYNLAVRSYGIFLWFAAKFHRKARLLHVGRKHWRENLKAVRKPGTSWIWIHCASAGEFEDVAALIGEMRARLPEAKLLLSFHSPSGYVQHGKTSGCDHVMYLPLDTSRNARDFVQVLQPEIVLFSRSELWLHFLLEIQRQRIPAYLISLGMTTQSGFLRWPMRGVYRRCFRVFTQIFCKDALTQRLLAAHFQIEGQAMVTGNTRLDRVVQAVRKPEEVEGIASFVGRKFCVVVGSALPRDEANVLAAVAILRDLPIQWIVVPHEIDKGAIAARIAEAPAERLPYSAIGEQAPTHRVLYIDFVGKLKYIYQYADFAIVGGGHDRIGIHNILEPAVFGVPVTFGPRHRNYPEALELLQLGAAEIHRDASELAAAVRRKFQAQDQTQQRMELRAHVSASAGATQRVVEAIFAQ